MNLYTFLQEVSNDEPRVSNDGYRINCVFHSDTSKDLLVNYDGRYRCFRCGENGLSLSQFVSTLYHVPEFSFDTQCALDILYEYTEHGVTQAYEREQIERQSRDTYNKKNLEAAQRFYAGDLNGDPLAYTQETDLTPGFLYLYERGISYDAIKHYRIVDWQRFPQHPLLIPYVFNDEVFGYEQRRISSYAWPKTISMPGMKKLVHGFAPAGKTIGLVTEGALDQALTWQYGYRQYAQFSILGSHVSKVQAEIMAQYCDILLGAFDNDDAGDEAYVSLLKEMQPYGTSILRLRSPLQGLSFLTYEQFVQALDRCLWKLGLDHTAVLTRF